MVKFTEPTTAAIAYKGGVKSCVKQKLKWLRWKFSDIWNFYCVKFDIVHCCDCASVWNNLPRLALTQSVKIAHRREKIVIDFPIYSFHFFLLADLSSQREQHVSSAVVCRRPTRHRHHSPARMARKVLARWTATKILASAHHKSQVYASTWSIDSSWTCTCSTHRRRISSWTRHFAIRCCKMWAALRNNWCNFDVSYRKWVILKFGFFHGQTLCVWKWAWN